MVDRHWFTKTKWKHQQELTANRRFNTVYRSKRMHPKIRNLPAPKVNYFESGKWYSEWYASLFGIKVFSDNGLTGYTMRTRYTEKPYRL